MSKNNHTEFLSKLPIKCHNISIEPGKKVILTHRYVDQYVYIIKLTDMPGKQDVAIVIPRETYINCPSTHESFDRWFISRQTPQYVGETNETNEEKQLSLF